MQNNNAVELKLGVYRHYKGQHYKVEKVVQHSETDEYMVLYQMLYGDFRWWVRPLDLFLEPAILEGQPCERFQWVSESVTTELGVEGGNQLDKGK